MEDKEKQEQQQLHETLRDLAVKEICENLFSTRGDDSNLYADWPQIREPLLSCLSTAPPPPAAAAAESSSSSTSTSPLQILIPGCGSSRLPEHLYDAGFHNINNINFSKAVISEMLSRNVRSRPDMKWRTMDTTKLQFVDETFDVVLDKGGLDGLLEPELGPKLGSQYLSEVMRVLQERGKFICLTLGENHVLGTLFPKFRYGWRVTVYALPQKPSDEHSLQTFMVVAEKDSSSMMHTISLSFDLTSLPNKRDQVLGFSQAIEFENKVREDFSDGSDMWYTLKDLKLGGRGDLTKFRPGQRIQLTIGEVGHSRFVYRAVLLDSPQQSDSSPLYGSGVFLVPATRAHEWVFTSEEGQWMVVESSSAARLIMVFLDSWHTKSSIEELQEDLTPLVKQLEPWENAFGADVAYWGLGDEFKKRKLVHQVTSSLSGPIIVDEVVYENYNNDFLQPSKDLLFRRLTVQRSQKYVQSQALMKREESLKDSGEKERKSTHSSKSKKKGNRKKNEPHTSQTDDSSYGPKVDLDHLAGVYHAGMISGFALISSYLERMASTGQSVKATIIGLRAGLLPMFLHRCLPFIHIEVVEFDPVVRDLARDFFSFKEDERLKVHITDGILFVREAVKSKVVAEWTASCEKADAVCSVGASVSCESSSEPIEVGEDSNSVDILIVDVDSYDSSSGLTCPSAEFVEESFLMTVKGLISEEGLFIMNLLSKSRTMKDLVMSRMKTVFCNLYSLEIEDVVQDVIFATKVATDIDLDEASQKLKKLLKLNNPITGQLIIDAINSIENLK